RWIVGKSPWKSCPHGLRQWRERSLVAQPVKEVFHLVAPQLALIFDFTLACKIFDDENGLVGDFRFFDAKLEELFCRRVHPMKPDELFEFAFGHFGLVCCTIP